MAIKKKPIFVLEVVIYKKIDRRWTLYALRLESFTIDQA